MLSVTYSYAGGPTVTIQIDESATPQTQTAAIQGALDAVADHAGATVTLSAGTFTVIGTGTAADGCLRVGSDTTFQGAGMGETVVKLADGAGATTGIVRTDSGQTLADGSIKTTENVLIRDMTIDGNAANTTGNVDGFYCGPKPDTAAADTNIMLDGVEVTGVSRYGFDPHEQTVGLTITNCVAHDNGVDGFTIDFCSDVTLTNNDAYGNGRHGFNIVTGSSDVTMAGNDAWGNGGSGIAVQTGDNEVRSFTSGITITGGSVHDNGRYGIEARQANDIDIGGVSISGNDMGGVSLRGVTDVALAGNAISGNGGQAVRIDGYLQTFGDADPLNDRYIPTTGVIIDGVAQADPAVPPGVTLWSWLITAGDDSIAGSDGADRIAAGSGDDSVHAGAGNDVLKGGDGDDSLDGGSGNDALFGGSGGDTLLYTSGLDTLDGGGGRDMADFSGFGSAVYVDLADSAVEAWTSGAGTATIATATTAVADLVSVEGVTGTDWSDTITGNGSANLIVGGAGTDTLSGGGGNDTISGGAGNDFLSGGSGSDIFMFETAWGADTIKDFQRGRDRIDLSDVEGLSSFSQLSIMTAAGSAVVMFDGQSITLWGIKATQLGATDFLIG